MQNGRLYLAFFAVFSLLVVSCSKEEDPGTGQDPANKAILSFGTILNDLAGKQDETKQSIDDIPACSDDVPAFVEVVLYRDGNPIVGSLGNAVRINVNQTPNDNDDDGIEEYFTEASGALELDPGVYSLEYFTVLNAAGEVIWLSPRKSEEEGNLWNYVDAPLPFNIALGAGVKKYVDVEVLCFDDRDLNEYGYLFFDLEPTEALEFCLFANYCTPDGTHYPAAYSVDFWIGDSVDGTALYTDVQNELILGDDGVFRTDPLCFIIPNLDRYEDDEPYVHYEVTLLDWEEAYGEIEPAVIEGSLSKNDIEALFDGEDNIDFEHLRFGCTDGIGDDPEEDCPADQDCDGVPDGEDICPGKDDKKDYDSDGLPDECDGCPDVSTHRDEDGDCIVDQEDPCPTDPDVNCEKPRGEAVKKCETAYMFGDHTVLKDGDRVTIYGQKWGWAEFIEEGDGHYEYKIWADAEDNNLEKGIDVGVINLEIEGDEVEVKINLIEGNSLEKARIYLSGKKPRPFGQNQYHYSGTSLTYNLEIIENNSNKGFWIMIQADVCPKGG